MVGAKIGPYRVLKVLGEGGMGRVLLAEHALIKTRHAVKILHDQLSRSDVIVQRFINEARAAGAIGHRNVVEITHVDQLEAGGSWYLVMKYLEGRTLAELLASRQAPLDQRLVLHIIGEALNGLQAAHDRHIIHRDLKPENLYLTTAKGDPYRTILLDFGVAQLGHDAGVVTRTGAVIGTPQYMAPEQHRGAPIDLRVDLWAMGAILYEMATGRPPYHDDGAARGMLTGSEIFHRMMSQPAVDPRHYNPALTPGFASAILHALAVDPARRPASARALAVMLAAATPHDSYGPSGYEILSTHADELLEGDAPIAITPLPVPSMAPPPVASAYERTVHPGYESARTVHPGYESAREMHPGYESAREAVPAPVSTLGTTASQTIPAAPRRPQRRLLVAAIGVVLAAAVAIVAVAGRDTTATTAHREPAAQPGGAGSGAERPGAPADQGGAAAERTGTAVERAGTAVERAGTAVERAGGTAARAGTAVEHAGSAAERALAPEQAPHATKAIDALPPDAAALPSAAARTSDAAIAAVPIVVDAAPAAGPGSAAAARRPDAGVVAVPITADAAPTAGLGSAFAAPASGSAVATRSPGARAGAGSAVISASKSAPAPGKPSQPGAGAAPSNSSATRVEPVATGRLKIVVLPWAEVWVDGKPLGQTPTTTTLPVGVHRVRLKNDSKDKTVTITVTASRTTVIDETW